MADRPPIRIGVAGALGRMGQVVSDLARKRADMQVVALFDRPGTEGQACGPDVLVTADEALKASDVVIDFTIASASAGLARRAAEIGDVALVIGATGFTEEDEAPIRAAAQRLAIVKSGNYSLGVNILAELVEQVARRLPAEDWDVEVLESHHRRKIDAPSGTALMLGEAAAEGRGVGLGQVAARARDGITGARREGDIGFAVLRGGGIVGEHSVVFAAEDEILTLSHSARDRGLFGRGVMAAAAWVAGRPPGLYDMKDVLGFRS
ncbi:4-hydroxy-tetrahydrodipicolinate reductase [Caulobacter sp. KR2-114]|uniref:4-hydroxy-tetrahydrodipicolinate reductase n=1 Tax=Caulobacter sp. KR2-114 TaxID=3400912 RepID=UPI003C070D5D